MACQWKQVLTLILVIFDVIFLIGSPIAMIAVGAALGKPFHATRLFTGTTCTVQEVKRPGQISCYCDKGAGCKSQYPCVEILVKYTTRTNATVEHATLFDDAHNFIGYGYLSGKLVADATKCSTYSCERSKPYNQNRVARFVRSYGTPGQSYPCYYNQEDGSEVLLTKLSTTALALGLLFPLLCFIAALALFIFLYHRILSRRGEKLWCLGRTYDIQPNELSPPVPVITISGDSTF